MRKRYKNREAISGKREIVTHTYIHTKGERDREAANNESQTETDRERLLWGRQRLDKS